MSLLMIFLTIIAGFIVLSIISSLILGFLAFRKKNKEAAEYRERVNQSIQDLKDQGLYPKSKSS